MSSKKFFGSIGGYLEELAAEATDHHNGSKWPALPQNFESLGLPKAKIKKPVASAECDQIPKNWPNNMFIIFISIPIV